MGREMGVIGIQRSVDDIVFLVHIIHTGNIGWVAANLLLASNSVYEISNILIGGIKWAVCMAHSADICYSICLNSETFHWTEV